MSLTLIFQLSLYGMVGLSAVTLAVAAESPVPALLTLPVAVAGFYFVDRQRTFSLPDQFANILGALAILLTFWGVFASDETLKRVLAGAHLLVYLTWIVIAQRKLVRQYWFLAALSWLQIAVAAVLTSSGWLGVLLFAFVFLGVWTLSLFALYQGASELLGERRLLEASALAGDARLSPEWIGGHARTPGPLNSVEMVALVIPPTRVRPTIQHDNRELWITPRYASGILGIALLGFLIGFAFFLFTPRFWMGEYSLLGPRHEGPASMTITGFTGDVQLGDMGTILENPVPVMKFVIYDRKTEKPIVLEEFLEQFHLDAPTFRGNVLDTYERGKWKQNDPSRMLEQLSRAYEGYAYRQEIVLQPTGTPYLFTMFPFMTARAANSTMRFPVKSTNSVVYRATQQSREPFEYYLYFPASLENAPAKRGVFQGGQKGWDEMHPAIRGIYTVVPENLPKLSELTKRVIAEAGITQASESTHPAIAEALVRHLRDTEIYLYSLDASVSDTTIDPVEDFLFNRRKGHCEYFASSLCLMLRVAGIPSRMVTGFKGAVENTIGGFYEVQQRHSHAWVEAWYGNEWHVLDATPPSRDEDVRQYGRTIDLFGDLSAALSTLWSEYVVSLNQTRQEQMFLDPLQNTLEGLKNPAARSAGFASLFFHVIGQNFRGSGGRIHPLGIVFLLLPFALIALAIWWGRRVLRRLWNTLRKHGDKAEQARLRLPFVVQFERLAAMVGCAPASWQTIREFSSDVARRLSELALPEAVSVTERVRDTFERVRYGNEPIPATVSTALEQDLTRLESQLRERETQASR